MIIFYLYTYIDIFARILENMHAVFHLVSRHFIVIAVVVAKRLYVVDNEIKKQFKRMMQITNQTCFNGTINVADSLTSLQNILQNETVRFLPTFSNSSFFLCHRFIILFFCFQNLSMVLTE